MLLRFWCREMKNELSRP